MRFKDVRDGTIDSKLFIFCRDGGDNGLLVPKVLNIHFSYHLKTKKLWVLEIDGALSYTLRSLPLWGVEY